MKQVQIQAGGKYLAKVSGKIVTVRVDAIREGFKGRLRYDVTNLATNRTLTFRSAMRFRKPAPESVGVGGLQGTVVDTVELSPERYTQLLADDVANRTPDSDLDASEREDQPDEVEKNRILDRLEST